MAASKQNIPIKYGSVSSYRKREGTRVTGEDLFVRGKRVVNEAFSEREWGSKIEKERWLLSLLATA